MFIIKDILLGMNLSLEEASFLTRIPRTQQKRIAVMTQLEFTDFSYLNASIFKLFQIDKHQSDIQMSSFLHQLNSAIFTKGDFSSNLSIYLSIKILRKALRHQRKGGGLQHFSRGRALGLPFAILRSQAPSRYQFPSNDFEVIIEYILFPCFK